MNNVVIWAFPQFNWLWVPLAQKLKSESGARIHFICSAQQNVEYWEKKDKKGIVDSYVTLNHFFFEYDRCSQPADEVFALARKYESKYGVLTVDVLQTDRHLGRGFSAAGVGHPRSELSDKSDYVKSVNLFNQVFKFWEDYFARESPDLVIGIASAVTGKICSVVARYNKVPVRGLTHASYKSYFYWGSDEYYTNPGINKNFSGNRNSNDPESKEEVIFSKRLPWAEAGYKEFARRASILKLTEDILKQVKIYLNRKCRHIVTMGNYRLSENIKYLFRVHNELKAVSRLKMVKVKDLQGKSFVFLPLHVEPESSMGMMSPEFNEQLALVELIAKNLPAGVWLVVKEHLVVIGRRPKEFYTTIQDIPNVLMLHPLEYAAEAARVSNCVAVVTGTLGLESALMGIPVISFGRHNNYNILEHVHVVDSWIQLRPLLFKLCQPASEDEKEKRKKNGLKYLAALKASSVDLNGCDYISKERPSATEEEVKLLHSMLIKSLN